MALSYLTIAFILFYIAITTRDYVARPPELVSQGDIDLMQVEREIPFDLPIVGLRVGYTNVSSNDTERVEALENKNPFVRYHFRHVVMKDQERVRETELALEECVVSSIPSLCPVNNRSQYKLKGTYFKQDYEFLEIAVEKCVGEEGCAPLSEINQYIQSGELRIRAQVSFESQQFDVERFHATGSGVAVTNRSFEFFGLPDVELQSDIFFQARQIGKEQRYAGSPPMPETQIDVLTLERRETNFRPRLTMEENLMTFAIRLSDNVRIEEVSYWCPSILDLFGLWGAMTSFTASLSLGFIALQYNKWHFHRHFEKAARQKRLDAQRQTLAAMEWIRNSDNSPNFSARNREDIYSNLQTQYDALMVEPDIRLFETHHFSREGRVALSAAELKFPSTAFGELRRLAILEHGKKKRAAQFLSLWYGRHLARKGFIDEKRRRELFATADEQWSNEGGKGSRTASSFRRGGFLQTFRRRRSENIVSRSQPSLESGSLNDMENGTPPSGSKRSEPSISSSIGVPSGDSESCGNESGTSTTPEAKEMAFNVIAEMDFGTKTNNY